jgi:glycosyltransferase involved in cell wall biosynthesis
MVVGSAKVLEDSGGKVKAFATPDESMAKRMMKARHAAIEAMRQHKTDLIAVHFALYAVPIPDLIRKSATVVHFHGPWAAESGVEQSNKMATWIKAKMEQSVYSAAKRFIVLSSAFKTELTRRYGVEEERVRVIPGGVNTARFNCEITRAEARSQLGWRSTGKIFVSVRRQVRRMGLENLIDAAEILQREGLDFTLYLGGTGNISAELQTRINDRQLGSKVKMLGRIPDSELPLVYRAADLSIVPSQSLEGFGLIAVESLAAGTPVLVTPVGGLPEIVLPFAPQCVFENTSAQAIANGLRQALDATEMLPSEEACRSYATDNFSWLKIASQVRGVYEEAIT